MKVFRYIILVLLAYSLPLFVYGEEQNGHATNNLQGMTVLQNENGEFLVKMEFKNLPDKQYNLKPIGKNTYILPLPNNKTGEKAKFTYVGNNTYIMLLPNARASISENDIVYPNGKENINVSMQEHQDITNPENISTEIIFQTKDNSAVKVSAYSSSTEEQTPENTANINNQENLENTQNKQNKQNAQNKINNNNDNITENTENNQNNYSNFLESNNRTLSTFDWFCYILTLILGIICLYLIRKQTYATTKKKNKKKHRKSAAVKISTYDEDVSVTVKNNFYKDITPPSETYAFDNENESQFKKSTNTSLPISYKATPSSTIFQKTEQKSSESSLLVLDSPKTEIITNNSNSYQTQEEKEEDLSFFDIENHDEILPDVGVESLPSEEGEQNNNLTFFELDNEKFDTNNTDIQIEINDTSAFDINESTNSNNYDYFSLIDIDDENIPSTVIKEEPSNLPEGTISQNLEEESDTIDDFTLLDNTENSIETINEQKPQEAYNLYHPYDSSDQNEEVIILDDLDSTEDIVFEEKPKDVITNNNIDFDTEEEFTIIDDTEYNEDIEDIEKNNNIMQDIYQQNSTDNEEVIFTKNEDKFNNEDLTTIVDDTKNDIITDIVPNIENQRTNTETLLEPVQSEDFTLENNSADIENEEVTFLSDTNNINLYQRNLQYIQAKTKQIQDTNGITHSNNEIEFNKQKENNIDNIVVFSNTNIEETEAQARAEAQAKAEAIEDKITFENNMQQNKEQNQENDLNQKCENLSDAYKIALASAHNEKEEKQPEIIEDFKMNDSNRFCLMKYGSKVSIVGNIDNKVFVLKTFNPEQIGSEHLFMEFCTKSNTSSIYSIILNNFKALVKVTDKEISLIGEYA